MKKYGDNLFQIGEAAKILGVTRKAILVYEEMGLLTPAVKDKDSGFRYYSADNLAQIRSIRSLQTLGLSLKEVAEYYYDTENMDAHLQRLLELRAGLDRNIQTLQARAARQGDLTVRSTALPRQVCFCRRYQCQDTAEAAVNLRNTYIAAARTGLMSKTLRFFTMRMTPDPNVLDLMCCIPVEERFDGPERVGFAETSALCVYYGAPMRGQATLSGRWRHISREHGVQTTGPFRSIYLEGPPNRGENSGDYITQVAVPIKGLLRD